MNNGANKMETTQASFTISERAPGVWGASYFRDEFSRPLDQGIEAKSLEDAIVRVIEISSIFKMPYNAIRTRTYAGVWGQVA
jgi:hypothetical protein